ncbi:uncharacterized protein LOC117815809 [Notolabrus celidotus]|uniref:uncharacterized protein LOC117815809 n=1 Tax=Notolabrus celidotus TaxID=1203425 RepID=UPI00148FCF67|nr:uncharacterized protein LOC117815809 [Notolabrus celidotus]
MKLERPKKMSDVRHQRFRSFLTERFTAMAVDVFGEVEAIVEAYCEENKRLRNVLHMVLNPEIKLLRIDDVHHTGATRGSICHPTEQTEDVSMDISEPLHIIPKEEQLEYDISCESAEQHALEGSSDVTDWVKHDPDADDSSMPPISDSYDFKVVEVNQDSSVTASAEDDDSSSLDSDALEDCPRLSWNGVSTGERLETRNPKRKSKKKKKRRSLQKTVLELPRMMPSKCVIPTPSDCQSFLSRLTEAFKDFPEDKKPLITKVGLSEGVDFVDCAFGKVPKGSPLSYQCPVPSSKDYQTHDHASPRPQLPLSYHTLEPVLDFPSSLSTREQEHVDIMQITWENAQCLESSTRPPHGHKELAEELLKLRLTSRFREICILRPGKSNADHLIFKIQKGGRKYKNSQVDEEIKSEALREYCRLVCVNWSPCGLVVHPNAPWLGALPHGLVYDPKEKPSYGLVHVKCVQFRSFMDCSFLVCKYGVLQLKKTHPLYWHMQGEMMVAGMSWCDLLVFSNEDLLVQRIYRDKSVIDIMKKKLDNFFFYYYLPSLV